MTPSQRIEHMAREMGGGHLLPENVDQATRIVQMDQRADDQTLDLAGLQIQHDSNVIRSVEVVANQINHNQDIR